VSRRPPLTYPEAPIFDDLRRTAADRPNKVAILVPDGPQVTFAELDAASDRIAAGLRRRGVGLGDVVAVSLGNVPEFAMTYYGVLKAGAIISPMNPLFRGDEVTARLLDCGARIWILAPEAAAASLGEVRARVPGLREAIVAGSPAWEDLLATPGGAPAPGIRPREDVAVLPYSSGTTGMPKGVMLTHFNVTSNVRQSIVARGLSDDDILLNHLPLYHIYGMTVLMAMPFARGLTTILMPRFDPGLVLAHIGRYRPTRYYTVPPAILALVRHPAIAHTDCRSIRTLTAAAAPLPLVLAEEFEAKTGVPVRMGYGLTETSPTTHVHPDEAPRPGTCGTPISDTEQRIVDAETGGDLPPGEAGELLIKGPQVMRGFWRHPEATAEVLREGWLHTGDIGFVDPDGYLTVVDRKKDMIKYKAYPVAPFELEELLMKHPAVADCAVVGAPGPDGFEVPRAYVVLRPGARGDGDELMAFVADRVAPYKKVRQVEFVREIPRSPSGKILRRLLKERAR
jgi:acyl-CoA synthetase (AMP-forming)/AMP-acid ligase II